MSSDRRVPQHEDVQRFDPAENSGHREVSWAQQHRLEFEEARSQTSGKTVIKVIPLDPARGTDNCLDVDTAWMHLCDRHSVLRSVFPPGARSAFLLELERFHVQCALSGGDVDRAVGEAIRRWRRDHHRTDINPLARLVHIHDEQRPVAVLLVDHLVFDGLSAEIVSRELRALLDGEELCRLESDFYDFADEQRRLLEDKPELTEYWVDRLRGTGIRPILGVPRLYDEVPGEHYPELRRNLFPFGPSGADSLTRLARAHSTTPYAVAATCLLVAARSYQSENTVGFVVPSHGRSLPGTENLVGFFSNMLTVAVEIPERVEDALAATTRSIFEAIDNDIVPKACIIRAAYPQYRLEDPSGPYFFFDMARGSRSAADRAAGIPRRVPSTDTRSEPGLSIYLHADDGESWIEVHSTDAYSDEAVDEFERRIADAFRELKSSES